VIGDVNKQEAKMERGWMTNLREKTDRKTEKKSKQAMKKTETKQHKIVKKFELFS
jgi:hypothetical protein